MTTGPLGGVVEDWGGFEKLVAKLHETGTASVEHDVTLTGQSGAPRQIDVLVRHREGMYEHAILVECKYWQVRVTRLHVDALVTAVRDIRASKGVIFSVEGFESGAVTQAEHAGIELYKVRMLTDAEWGLPGRHIDFYLQYFQRSLGNFAFPEVRSTSPLDGPMRLSLHLSDGPEATSNPTVNQDGSPGPALEEIIARASSRALDRFVAENEFILCSGADCTRYMQQTVNFEPPTPILVPWQGSIVIFPRIVFDLGFKIAQTRFQHDRAQNLIFALAIEDCIKNAVHTASRRRDEEHTKIVSTTEPANRSSGAALQNGSVLRVIMRGFFPFEEMSGMQEVSFDCCRKPLSS